MCLELTTQHRMNTEQTLSRWWNAMQSCKCPDDSIIYVARMAQKKPTFSGSPGQMQVQEGKA